MLNCKIMLMNFCFLNYNDDICTVYNNNVDIMMKRSVYILLLSFEPGMLL